MEVWVTQSPKGDCDCWRDALCTHGWTWQEERECQHDDDIVDDVHESLADAIRDLFQNDGRRSIGRVLREREVTGPYSSTPGQLRTRAVYVMPPGGPLVDDHDACVGDGPSPYRVIERKELTPRSKPSDEFRKAYAYFAGDAYGNQS